MECDNPAKSHVELATRRTVNAGGLLPGDWILRNPAPKDSLVVYEYQLAVILVTKVELDISKRTVDITLKDKSSTDKANNLCSYLLAQKIPIDLEFEVLRNR